MLIRELTLERAPIDGYGDSGFRVGGTWYEGSVLVTQSGVFSCDFTTFEANMIEADTLLLVGTGHEMRPLPPAFRTYLQDHNITYDMMQTASACRTYNVLLAEDRAVSVLLVALNAQTPLT